MNRYRLWDLKPGYSLGLIIFVCVFVISVYFLVCER